jgi:dipeptidyl aminopeptidase/acylaminoacyl peptidase
MLAEPESTFVRTTLFFLLAITTGIATAAPPQVTDPLTISSPVRADFAPAPIPAISALDDVSPGSWSPDGRYVLYLSSRTGIDNIWLTEVATGKARALAPSKQAQSSPVWSPDGKRVAFLVDDAGNELYDVMIADVASGQLTNVTGTAGMAEEDPAWSPDGRYLAFSARLAANSFAQIDVIDLDTKRRRALTRGGSPERSRRAPLWSASGDAVYFTDVGWSFTDSNVMRVSVNGGTPENLTPHAGEVLNTLEDLSSDGRWALTSSTASNGWQNVAVLDLRAHTQRWITQERSNHFPGAFSPDSTLVTYVRDQDDSAQIFAYDLAKQVSRQLTNGIGLHELEVPRSTIPHVGARTFSPDGKRIVYRYESGTSPSELRTLTLQQTQEVSLVVPEVPPNVAHGLTAPVHVWFDSRDRKFRIPALVWMPPNLKRDASNAAIVEIHGGPMDQRRPALLSWIQVLVTRGFVVISPNYRGSTNYDRNFFRANRMDMGGGDLEDVATAADFLIRTGYVDPKRIGAYGASNGAYLTLLALGKQPERWRAGAALYPFVDYFTGYATELPWIQSIDRVLMGDPARHAALWRDRSPITHAASIRAPVLMTAGANDPRCPPEQARQMERAIRDAGGSVELKIFGEQGHGTQEVDSYTDENTMVVNFFDQHLRGLH